MRATRAPSGKSEQVIAEEIARIEKAAIPQAIEDVMILAATVDSARTLVVDTKASVIRRACDGEGYSVRRVAELMGVSVGYVQRLKTQR